LFLYHTAEGLHQKLKLAHGLRGFAAQFHRIARGIFLLLRTRAQ
jgi:hypothetical protein